MRAHFPREAKGCYWCDPARGICALCWLRVCFASAASAMDARVMCHLGPGDLGRRALSLPARPVLAIKDAARAWRRP